MAAVGSCPGGEQYGGEAGDQAPGKSEDTETHTVIGYALYLPAILLELLQ
jgi:hypothetical protein